jgi:hypothetical protein
VHVTDALNTDTGGFALLQDTQKPHDVGAWLHIPAKFATVIVPARTATGPGVRYVPVRMVVPLKATPGDHVGGIVVSLVSTAKSGTGQTYKLVQRVGSRIFVRVSGPLRPQLTVSHVSAAYHGTLNPVGKGTATVSYVVTNSGNVAMGATQEVTVSGILGSTSAPTPDKVPLLLPGSSIRLTVHVPGVLPTFVKSATVRLTPLYVPGTLAPAAGPWTGSTTFWAVPWPLICLVLLVVVAVLGYTRWRHRRAAGPPPDEPTVVDRQPEGVPS